MWLIGAFVKCFWARLTHLSCTLANFRMFTFSLFSLCDLMCRKLRRSGRSMKRLRLHYSSGFKKSQI